MPVTKKKLGARARHIGVNRLEQAERIREILRTLPPEKRKLTFARELLEDKGIEIKDHTISNHLSKIRGEINGASGGGELLDRISAVSRALEACGGVDGLNETIKLVKKIGKVLK